MAAWGVLQGSGASRYPSAWAAALAGPIAWFVDLEVVYALAPHACAVGSRLSLHLATIACLGAVALGGAMARVNWERAGRRNPSDTDHGPEADVAFLSLLGLMTASLFGLLIVAQWIAVVALDPCPLSADRRAGPSADGRGFDQLGQRLLERRNV